MNYFTDQNTSGYTPEQLQKMNEEIEKQISTNSWDEDFNQQEIKTAQEKILAEMDKEIENTKVEELIKEAFEEFCDGDNNGENFLSAQYSDWVTAKLDFSTAEYSKDNCYVSVEGIIEHLAVFKENGKFKSAWGDAHEFDEKDIKEDTDEYYLKDVKGYWTFEINIEKDEWCYQGYNITFSEFAATEI